jgi:hypothetical protein
MFTWSKATDYQKGCSSPIYLKENMMKRSDIFCSLGEGLRGREGRKDGKKEQKTSRK